LFSRVRTSGIVTERYIIDGTTFEMYDVGGQRNERKKWIHCFEGVTAVIFVAAISEYDQKLFEDASTNRMVSMFILFLVFTNLLMLLFFAID
jgi:membrane-associated HD superfamily phosphohydrolase